MYDCYFESPIYEPGSILVAREDIEYIPNTRSIGSYALLYKRLFKMLGIYELSILTVSVIHFILIKDEYKIELPRSILAISLMPNIYIYIDYDIVENIDTLLSRTSKFNNLRVLKNNKDIIISYTTDDDKYRILTERIDGFTNICVYKNVIRKEVADLGE